MIEFTPEEITKHVRIGWAVCQAETALEILTENATVLDPALAQRVLAAIEKYGLGVAELIVNEAQVREIIERRLAPQPSTPQEEAAHLVAAILDHGVAVATIAERCRVNRNAVGHWKAGRSAPKDHATWGRLAAIGRAALALPSRAEQMPAGMPRVVFAIMRKLDVPAYEVAARTGNQWPRYAGPRWLRGATKPGRLATIRLRSIAREIGLGEEVLATCDRRLREIREAEVRFGARRLPLMSAEQLPSAAPNPREDDPMTHAPLPNAPAGAGD
jgi:hypothetical protein